MSLNYFMNIILDRWRKLTRWCCTPSWRNPICIQLSSVSALVQRWETMILNSWKSTRLFWKIFYRKEGYIV